MSKGYIYITDKWWKIFENKENYTDTYVIHLDYLKKVRETNCFNLDVNFTSKHKFLIGVIPNKELEFDKKYEFV